MAFVLRGFTYVLTLFAPTTEFRMRYRYFTISCYYNSDCALTISNIKSVMLLLIRCLPTMKNKCVPYLSIMCKFKISLVSDAIDATKFSMRNI